ncbi:hypothetical protein EI42_04517 [Thermosporothrix hazakensis]|uniref:Helix-turn-helix protein n=2 Tax=Thermosporothrix TaxID=768650 RepID=A0A326U5F4_THEHA|nr:XRE family transcriptional regulator [Thermosporothrix hazakensis]PZW24909.1 hypothetical protein EI42_04517 [Thermosporothrix hazakensis]BBH88219.1 hypothetical protein KTC_29700 [Thermosporothrix sp. COM3]GCE46405.1 hypothetical protein KTH_12740 [Thermosporothrix hazakensis]
MTIYCTLRPLLARVNQVRTSRGLPPLSLRRLSAESGVPLSVIAALNTGRSRRIDYGTVDQLLHYFSRYFSVTVNDLLSWERNVPSEQEQSALQPHAHL